MLRTFAGAFIFVVLCTTPFTLAADDPVEQRHELMKDVGEAAKPLGEMLKAEREFDAATALQSFLAMQEVAGVIGDLFPEGSYVGGEKKARDTVWSDRAGFDRQLAEFSDALAGAVAANPQSLAALEPAAGAVFKVCKACHEDYRIPGE